MKGCVIFLALLLLIVEIPQPCTRLSIFHRALVSKLTILLVENTMKARGNLTSTCLHNWNAKLSHWIFKRFKSVIVYMVL